MRLAVLGTGSVGQTLGDALVGLGHDVAMGSRSADNESASAWAAHHAGDRPGRASHGTFADAVRGSDLVINATSGTVSIAVLESVGEELLGERVVLDVSNPLDFSQGFPPRLSVCNDDSVAEQLQRAFPQARVVKALNTMHASVMVDPGRLPAPTDVFVAGDDADAKATVTDLLASFGWPRDRVRDLGDITAARGLEMYLPLWVRLFGATGTAELNIAVVTSSPAGATDAP
jgi:8-hydroxy-5-deazaflavin:NADPH oxidoreductase